MRAFRKILLILSILVFVGSAIYLGAITVSVFSGSNPDAAGLDFLAVLIIVLGYGGLGFGISLVLGIISLIFTIVMRRKGDDANLLGPISMIILPIATEAIFAGILFVFASL